MADKADGGKSAAKMRWVIIGSLVALGVYLYIRHNKQQAAASSSGTQGSTNPNPSVPTYSLSSSGLYNGGYTPYTIINSSRGNMTSTFPGASGSPAVTNTTTNTVNSSGISQSNATTVTGQ